MSTDGNWSGYVEKKAFKTLTKISWKRRWLVFNASDFNIKWADNEAKANAPKGTFTLEASELIALPCDEHKKPYELQISSKGQTLYISCESAESQAILLSRIDAARRSRVASMEHGPNDTLTYRTADDVLKQGLGVFPGEPGKKVFSWGVGSLLGIGKADISAMAVPQRITSFMASPSVLQISAGPEHAAAVTDAATTLLWGSNEFYQLAQSQDAPAAARPVPVLSLSGKRVLQVACGGSHTLALISEATDATVGAPGVLFGWGTGTVGQLGLGSTMPILDAPSPIVLPNGSNGKPSLASQVFAGLVSSAAISSTGECYVWGDASAGRLGLPNIPDLTPVDAVPQFVNATVVWNPTPIRINPSDLGMKDSANLRILSVALGGSFTLFLVHTGSGPGGVLLASGSLGWDITRDTYGYPPKDDREVNQMIDEEVKMVPRRSTPTPLMPYGVQSVVLAITAGARHIGVIIADPMRGGAPRLYTAGKGWLGHNGTADTTLLERPTVSANLQPVAGIIAEEDIVEVGCGHSHTIARTSDGRLFAWGRGDSGELGHGNLSDRSLPIACRSIDGHYVSSVAAGSYYSVVVADAGMAMRMPPNVATDNLKGKLEAIAKAQQTAIDNATVKEEKKVEEKKPEEKKKAVGGGKEDMKKKKEQEAQDRARAALDESELPPDWSWDQTDDGETYYIRPDGETQWDDPRDDWDTYWPAFMEN